MEQKKQQKQQQKKGGGGQGGGGKKKKKEDESPYRSSVSLPDTAFSQRANAVVREPELQQFWEEEGIYKDLADKNPGEVFVLHDGPPYANGDLHIGHALNKILKDLINRYQLLRGRKVRYVPGWDCHGLPIELKVLQSMKSAEREALTPLSLREKAASFAKETVEKQSASFRRYGVWGDFEDPYLTLQGQPAQEKFGELGGFTAAGMAAPPLYEDQTLAGQNAVEGATTQEEMPDFEEQERPQPH